MERRTISKLVMCVLCGYGILATYFFISASVKNNTFITTHKHIINELNNTKSKLKESRGHTTKAITIVNRIRDIEYKNTKLTENITTTVQGIITKAYHLQNCNVLDDRIITCNIVNSNRILDSE